MISPPPRQFVTEWLDDPAGSGASQEELAGTFRDISRLDRLVGARRRWRRLVVEALDGRDGSVLDVGTGAGDAAEAVYDWGASHGLSLVLTGLDTSSEILGVAGQNLGHRNIELVQGDARALPFADRSFDLVGSVGLIHHFSEEEAVSVLREMGRVARKRIVVLDLERSRLLTACAPVALRVLARNELARHDGVVTVRRAFTAHELLDLATRAGLEDMQVRRYVPFLHALVARGQSGPITRL